MASEGSSRGIIQYGMLAVKRWPRMEMDVSSQSASIEQKPVNHRESAEHESNPQAVSATRSCEDVFGEF